MEKSPENAEYQPEDWPVKYLGCGHWRTSSWGNTDEHFQTFCRPDN